MEREQREQARQERHAARALATAAALSIQDEGTSGAGSCHDEQAPPPPNDSSPDSPQEQQQQLQQLQQQHDNYFSRSSVTEESCSPAGYGGDSRLYQVDYTPSPVINSAELADLLLEVRLVCVSVCWPLLYFIFEKKDKFFYTRCLIVSVERSLPTPRFFY